MAFKEEVTAKLKDAQELSLGTEIPQGTLEQTVTVKIGDDLDAMMGAEILLEDGKNRCVSSIMKHNDFITIGVIIAPHGVRGDLSYYASNRFSRTVYAYGCLLHRW